MALLMAPLPTDWCRPATEGAVSDASAAVDVIGANNGAREFLHHVVGFITGPAGGAGGLDRVRAIFFSLMAPRRVAT